MSRLYQQEEDVSLSWIYLTSQTLHSANLRQALIFASE